MDFGVGGAAEEKPGVVVEADRVRRHQAARGGGGGGGAEVENLNRLAQSDVPQRHFSPVGSALVKGGWGVGGRGLEIRVGESEVGGCGVGCGLLEVEITFWILSFYDEK